jgi:hypothetical protein
MRNAASFGTAREKACDKSLTARKRLFQFIGQAEIIDDEAAGLVLEHAVDAGDGLHQPMAAHRLVDIHRV